MWNTEKIATLIRAVPDVTSAEVQDDGEDYTTHSVFVSIAGTDRTLWVRGFVTGPNAISANDDVEVEFVEVTTGYSDGDMPDDPALIMAQARIKVALIEADFSPVNSLDRYF